MSLRARGGFVAASVGTLALGGFVPAPAQTLPPGFHAERIAGGWREPTGLCFAGEHEPELLVTEKAGLVWSVRDGAKQAAPIVDLQDEVLDNGSRGLHAVAADPDFDQNGRLYLLYVVDPDGDGVDAEQESFGRVTRYATYVDANGDRQIAPGSRHVLIGLTWASGIPSIHFGHDTGDLRFAEDGALLVSTGDGAHADLVDAGGHDPNGFGPDRFPASEDVGAYRSQTLSSLAGKLLRIDPGTGRGLPDNPFFTGDADANASRLFALGFRNPFRFTLVPGSGSPGRLWIADVGWELFEELDDCGGGENFGWPCFEGPGLNLPYDGAAPDGECADPALLTLPVWSYHHSDPLDRGFTGQCVTGLCVYTGTDYPPQYQGRLFFSEYVGEWIRTVRFVGGQPTEVETFAADLGTPIALVAHPENGDLVYIALEDDSIRRIGYASGNLPPVVVASATPGFGATPLLVTLDASGSSDPEQGSLSFHWELGDGNTADLPTAVHSYPQDQDYAVTLTVTDAGGARSTWTTTISAGNTPPTITAVHSPADGGTWRAGDLLTLDASATDVEDAAAGLTPAAEWRIDLVHDHHVHPGWATRTGFQASYAAEAHEPGTWYQVVLTVTDQRGLADTRSLDLFDADARPRPHLAAIADGSPRLRLPVEVTGHLHFPGPLRADLTFDWGDGTSETFHVHHMEDVTRAHVYAAPGDYRLRLHARVGRNEADVATTEQPILVRPLAPGVALFAPLVRQYWMSSDEQWQVASGVAADLRAAGFEAETFGAASQEALRTWLEAYRDDGLCDWIVCVDAAPAEIFAGEEEGSRVEEWLEAGNALLWTGFTPFARGVLADGGELHLGNNALDQVLDAAQSGLCLGSGSMTLLPPAADLPSLAPFDTTRGVRTSHLGAAWSAAVLYAADASSPPISDALVLRHAGGGEYAQFLCKYDPALPRAAVLREFLLSRAFAALPPGPGQSGLLQPHDRMRRVPLDVALAWKATSGATSYLVEVALDAAFTRPLLVMTVTGDTTGRATDLEPGRLHFWRVTSRNDFGTTTSATWRFRTEGVRRR